MGTTSTWPVEDDAGDVADEAALIAAAQGDTAAFGQLYERHLPAIYRYLRTHVASEEEAADLTQQVFLKALQALPGYRLPGPPFAAWLFRIARNLAIDAGCRRRPVVSWELVPEREHPVDARDPERIALGREALDDLRLALARLDDEKRDLLILRLIVGLPPVEIAPMVGKCDAAVRQQMSRSLKRLKELYRGE